MLAAYGEGRKWSFEGDAEVKSKFWGRSIELTPVGILKLTFHDGEAFTWSKVGAMPLYTPVSWAWVPDILQQLTRRIAQRSMLSVHYEGSVTTVIACHD